MICQKILHRILTYQCRSSSQAKPGSRSSAWIAASPDPAVGGRRCPYPETRAGKAWRDAPEAALAAAAAATAAARAERRAILLKSSIVVTGIMWSLDY